MRQTILKPEAMMIVPSQNRANPVPTGKGDRLSQERSRLGILNGNRTDPHDRKIGVSGNCKAHPCRLGSANRHGCAIIQTFVGAA
jgi:hypothetical protein